MSRLFGEIRQIAFVVRDIDKAMKYWSETLGIGPFFIKRNITFSSFEYMSSPSTSPEISIALANSGYLQVELIEQHDQIESIYKDFLDQGHSGLQHMSSWLNRNEFIETKKHLLSQGYKIAQECVIESSGVNLIYFDTGEYIFEIADLNEPDHIERLMNIKFASENWDGKDFIIEVDK